MKKYAVLTAALVLALLAPLAARAQNSDNRDHFELGAFADYIRLHNANDANFVGVGGRIGVGVARHLDLEASMAYDFEKSFTSTSSTGGLLVVNTSSLRLWHGMFGPMVWFGNKHARVFGEVKGGFLHFSTNTNLASTVSNFSTGDTNGVLYPGGGVEFSAGPVGLRLDVGDMMYFDHGANHNLSVQLGPTLRF